jgi:hypothetical protein
MESKVPATAVRKLVVGIIICEYAMMEIVEGTNKDLKYRAKLAISAAKKVQDFFRFSSNEEHKKVFEKEFIKSEIFMLSELLETCWGLNHDDLEIIIFSIKGNIVS